MDKLIVECEDCGHKVTVTHTNLLTGWRFHSGWNVRCMLCGGLCKEVK